MRALETNPGQFVAVAQRTQRVPGVRVARAYTDAEIAQLNHGVVRLLREAARNEEPKARAMFMDHAVPSFIREGETPASLVHWNASYLVLLGAALAACVPSEEQAGVLEWFSGTYTSELFQAAIAASPRSKT